MYIDGTKDSEIKIESMISWDVMNGLVRRSWARNSGAITTVKDAQETNIGLEVTIPNLADENLLNRLFDRRDDSM